MLVQSDNLKFYVVFRTSFQIAPNGGKVEKEDEDYEDVDLGR